MTQISHKKRSAFAIWLFQNNIEYREGAPLFRCSHAQLQRIAEGKRTARGETAELIVAAVTGRISLDELRAGATVAPSAGSAPIPAARGKTASGGAVSPSEASLSGAR